MARPWTRSYVEPIARLRGTGILPVFPRAGSPSHTCCWDRRFVSKIWLPIWVMGLASLATSGCKRSPPPPPGTTAPAVAPIVEPWESQKPEFMEISRQLKGGVNAYLALGKAERFRARMNAPGTTVADKINWRMALCYDALRLGDTKLAEEEINKGFALADATPEFKNNTPSALYLFRGLTYLRQAEVANCVMRHNRDGCIFPLKDGGVHMVAEPARKARLDYLKLLEARPNDLEARWLLNLVSMALGDYPHGVPSKYLIPPEVFESDYDIKRFENIGPALGVHAFNLCGGAIADDFDNDGFLDIVTSTYDPDGPLTYYRNLGSGGFEDLSTPSRLDDQFGGLNCVATDYNNDGYPDILVLRGAWLFDDGQIRNSLIRNNRDGTFTDVTRKAGLGDKAYPTQTAAWGDFDNDGHLDVYIGNESRMGLETPEGDFPSQLFHNNGDGTFTDVAKPAGLTSDHYTKAVAAGDYDNDGDLDIYTSNVGKNRLFRNNGDGTFTDVADALEVTEPKMQSFATWFFDYDNDGWLDIFVGAFDATVPHVAADYLGLPHKSSFPRLYHNNGDGTFTDVAEQVGLHHPYLPMGANFGDLDNDGYLDIYLATGDPLYRTLMPNIMLRNDRGVNFQDVTTSGGFGHLQKGHGVAFADFDHDGDQDIYHQLGGFYPGDKFFNAFFRNPGHGNHFLTIKLVGTTTNRRAVGARIKVVLNTPNGKRALHRAAGCVSSFGGSPARQEIGLGDATSIDLVEINWPTSKTTQAFTDVPMDRMIQVVEGESDYTTPAFTKFELK